MLEPVDQGKSEEEDEKGKEQATLDEGIYWIGKEVVGDVFTVHRIGDAGMGPEDVEQEPLPLAKKGESDKHSKNQGQGVVEPGRSPAECTHQLLVSLVFLASCRR